MIFDESFGISPTFVEEYVEKYKGKLDILKRYGINIKSPMYLNRVLNDDDFNKPDTTQQNASPPSGQNSATASSVGTSKKKQSDQQANDSRLHWIESQLIVRAVRALQGNGDTVLVDIFTRTPTGIKFEPSGADKIPSNHAVVLYRHKPGTELGSVFVIDPSKFSFSRHLMAANPFLAERRLPGIQTIDKADGAEIEIYKAIGKTGPNIDNFRDCIDIAVKLAFELRRNNLSELTADSIRSNEAIRLVSNHPEICGVSTQLVICRIRQSSNPVIRKIFRYYQKNFTEMINILGDLNVVDSVMEDLIEKFREIVNNKTDGYKVILSLMKNHIEHTQRTLSDAINDELTII